MAKSSAFSSLDDDSMNLDDSMEEKHLDESEFAEGKEQLPLGSVPKPKEDPGNTMYWKRETDANGIVIAWHKKSVFI